jgi:homoserine dehydrogenase
MKKKINIGLFGFGCVGQELYEVLNESGLINAEITKIVVKTKGKNRSIPESYFGYDKNDILNDTQINTVVELIDDADAAYEIVTTALKKGMNVVSANKKLIAYHLDELIELGKANNVSFLYEASVCASIPIIRNIEEYYNCDALHGLQGICNGTTNYILSQTNKGLTYDEALQKAQELGFAESDPTLDVDGFDAKFKLQILLKHAFGVTTQPDDVFNYGVRQILPVHVQYAKEKGYKLKLFSTAKRIGDEVFGFVAPHYIPASHAAYNVEDEFNAIAVEALFSSEQLFVGKGAGSHPTASAVLSDIAALSYDYRYEYNHSKPEKKRLTFSNECLVKVFLGSSKEEKIVSFPFIERDELFIGKDYNYATGWVKFTDLNVIDFNNESDLFFAVLPEGINNKTTDKGEIKQSEKELVC